MAEKRIILELAYDRTLADMAFAVGPAGHGAFDMGTVPALTGMALDAEFAPTALPGQVARDQTEDTRDTFARFDLAMQPEESTYIVRGQVDEERLDQIVAELRSRSEVVGVFADPVIEPAIVCPANPAVGSDTDVERLLSVPGLRSIEADGLGILVAIVDTGINMAHLNAHGKNPTLDTARSWTPRPDLTPGSLPVGHGTMCAYDVCIAAPKCTLLDIALLQSRVPGPTPMSGLLSDALRAYRHLIDIMTAPRRPGENRSLVVNNSWGMFHPSWDLPVGDPGNYSDNPNHPFNRIVAALEQAGADILFAAGNCGPDCPDGRCQGVTANAIYGANSHAAVLCVAGVDTTKARVGYSSVGPGRLTRQKPDISGYTHFRGSGVYPADGGTSAATPVVAGVVAAVRSKRPFDPGTPSTHPAAIRTLLTSTAEDLGATGYDFQHGFGLVDGGALREKLAPQSSVDLCTRYPWLCKPIPLEICQRHPWLCRQPVAPPLPPTSLISPGFAPDLYKAASAQGASVVEDTNAEGGGGMMAPTADPVELSYLIGFYQGQQQPRDP